MFFPALLGGGTAVVARPLLTGLMLLASVLLLHAAYLPSGCLRHTATLCAGTRACNAVVALADAQAVSDAVAPPGEPEAPGAERDPEDVTLELLEWERLSAIVASQAGTRKARELLEAGLPVRHDRADQRHACVRHRPKVRQDWCAGQP